MLTIEEIKCFMKDRNQTSVSMAIGISKQTLNYILKGHRQPTYDTLKKLSDYLTELNMIEDANFMNKIKSSMTKRMLETSVENVKLSESGLRTLFYNEEYKIKIFSKRENINRIFNENLDDYNVFLTNDTDYIRLKKYIEAL